MPQDIALPAELMKRVEVVAERSGRTVNAVIVDALENGASIGWQERYVDEVLEGLAAADRGEFASEAEMKELLNRYRQS